VTSISKVNPARQSKSLRGLYQRREQIVQAIAVIEELQSLRLQRAEPAILALLAADRELAARQSGVLTRLAA